MKLNKPILASMLVAVLLIACSVALGSTDAFTAAIQPGSVVMHPGSMHSARLRHTSSYGRSKLQRRDVLGDVTVNANATHVQGSES